MGFINMEIQDLIISNMKILRWFKRTSIHKREEYHEEIYKFLPIMYHYKYCVDIFNVDAQIVVDMSPLNLIYSSKRWDWSAVW